MIKFSDGELSVDIGDNVRGRDVFIVQSTSAPVNEYIMELLIVIDALKRASASRITAVIPYFGYARQDRKLKPRVPITAKLVADLLTAAGAHRILTMDLHAGQIVGFFNIPVDNLYALPAMLPYLKDRYQDENLTIVSPDAGGVERARYYASHLNAELAIIDKRRTSPNKVSEMRVVGEVKGRNCLIVDDMVDTGGTLVKAAETIITEGAKDVSAVCVHGVLSGNALERIKGSKFKEVIITDTIERENKDLACEKLKVISVSELFAEAIQRIHNEDSVSSLFK